MYKLLIVDDEVMHRKGLSNMIKKLFPSYEIYEAKNGRDALELIVSNNMDIVITDIKMPIMDGLKLIERITNRLDKIKVIILSGYRDFEYAQKALSLGAFDYLLKPVCENKIIDILNKADKSIKENSSKAKERENLLKQLDNTLPVYFEHQMNKWVQGLMNQTELNEIEQIFQYKKRGIVIALSVGKYGTFLNNYCSDERKTIKQSLKYNIKKTLDAFGHSISFFLEEKKNIMLSILNMHDDIDILSGQDIDRLNVFIKNIKAQFGLDVTIAVGCQFDNIFKDVRVSYDQAVTALSYSFYYGIGKVIFYSDISHNISNEIIDISKEEEDLKEAVKQLRSKDMLSCINIIFQRIIEDKYPRPQLFIENMTHTLIKMVLMMRGILEETDCSKLLEDINQKLNNCEEYIDLNRNVTDILKKLIDLLEYSRDNKHQAMMERSIQYIEEHFMEDISLEASADIIYFSPSYYSTCFKKYTGIAFSQYLAQIRMKKAMELLETTENKVYEIASKTGYKDDKYFFRVFKKEHGITPYEYRRNVRNKKMKNEKSYEVI